MSATATINRKQEVSENYQDRRDVFTDWNVHMNEEKGMTPLQVMEKYIPKTEIMIKIWSKFSMIWIPITETSDG